MERGDGGEGERVVKDRGGGEGGGRESGECVVKGDKTIEGKNLLYCLLCTKMVIIARASLCRHVPMGLVIYEERKDTCGR